MSDNLHENEYMNENNESKEENTPREESESVKEESAENKSSSEYSYRPPNYTPENGGTNGASQSKGKSGGKKKHSVSVGIIAIIVAISIIITAIGGALVMFIVETALILGSGLKDIAESNDIVNGGPSDGANEGSFPNMNIDKNDNVIVTPDKEAPDGTLSIAEVVSRVSESVVEITTSHVANDIFYGQYVKSGAGSGVIIDSTNGYIITNSHVVDGARDISVILTNGAKYNATLVGSDPSKDIALVKIDAKRNTLTAATIGTSKNLVVGQEVVAIGNPLGSLGGTVTDGIISALDRSVSVDGKKMTLMQTNAAINPGNSGGGLFDRAGRLIGIVNAKKSSTGIEGLGFAVPIDVAMESVEAIMEAAS